MKSYLFRFFLVFSLGFGSLMLVAGKPDDKPEGEPEFGRERIAAYLDGETLHVAVTAVPDEKVSGTTLKVELKPAAGDALVKSAEIGKIKAPEIKSFVFDGTSVRKEDAVSYILKITAGDKVLEGPLSDWLFKAQDTYVLGQDEFASGSAAALRIAVRGARSLTESAPFAGAEVSITLKGKDIEKELFTGKTDLYGTVAPAFELPSLEEGEYTLAVKTKSLLGEDTIEKKVKIKSSTKILLVTDKPLYQPGQQIQVRALALGRVSMKPVGNSEILFEIYDPKGNKVFKKKKETNGFGIASTTFLLADEVNMGRYRIEAVIGKEKAEKTAEVKKYVLPKFKIVLDTEKKFFLPKETVKGFIQADYFFGKPVTGGKVTIKASTFDVRFRQFAALKNITTDDTGKAEFEFTLPDYFVGTPLEKGNALLKLDIELKDTADHTEKKTSTFPVAAAPIQVGAIPECGKLVPGIENVIYCVATYPDGSPAGNASVTLKAAQQGDKYVVEETVKTNAGGIAQFRMTPNAKWFQNRGYDYSKTDKYGRPRRKIEMDIFVSVQDEKGSKAERKIPLSRKSDGENIILRTDKAVYAAGETLAADILTTASKALVYLDITRGKQTVMTKTIEIADGKGHLDFNVTADIFGSLEVHAYRVMPSGHIMRDTRVIYVHPARQLSINIDNTKPTYLPGEENVAIDFLVTDRDGQPTQSALGIIIVDESVYALQDMQPGLEKLYFTLEAELAKPQVEICNHPYQAEEFVRASELEGAKQDAVKMIFASAEPVTEFSWNRNPATERVGKYRSSLYAILNAFRTAVQNFEQFSEKDEATGKWRFREDFLKKLAEKKWLTEEQIKDPLDPKSYISMKSLSEFGDAFSFEKWAAADTSYRKQVLWQAIWGGVLSMDVVEGKPGAYRLKEGALDALVKLRGFEAKHVTDCHGEKLSLEKLAKEEKAFTPANLALFTISARKKAIWQALWNSMNKSGIEGIITYDKDKKVWSFTEGAFDKLNMNEQTLRWPDGTAIELNALAAKEGAFAADNIISFFLRNRLGRIYNGVCRYLHGGAGQKKYNKGGKWELPIDILDEFVNMKVVKESDIKDLWGHKMRLIVREKAGRSHWGCGIGHLFQVISPGPDGMFGNADDWKEPDAQRGYTQYNQEPGLVYYRANEWNQIFHEGRRKLGRRDDGRINGPVDALGEEPMANGARQRRAFGGAPAPAKEEAAPTAAKPGFFAGEAKEKKSISGSYGGQAGVQPKPVRIREYFPETLLFEPSLITDESGRARLVLPQLADSITTFRMTASAVSRAGALGGTTGSIRIFQDFFVDIDLPVALTRGDEVSIPVAVYNYLKEDQSVKITMQKDEWFELLSDASQTLTLKPGEVTATYFRIRAKKVGFQKLLVKAEGSKMSDAMRRVIEVAPDGKMFEFVDNGRLTGEIGTQIEIPPDSIPGSYKILVKIYPGIFSQVTEGMEAMMRMPGG
ncbi:MAG: MG2 domain-containing protein [Planctomycetota bacterium]|jgi:hypothetical protein